MSAPVVNAEEIQNAEVIKNPVKQEEFQTRSRLNLVLCIALLINCVFQVIAIFTPGWNIITSDSVSTYDSVYYSMACVTQDKTLLGDEGETTECKSVTKLETFKDRYDAASSKSAKATLRLGYNLQVRFQLNVQFAWFIVVATTLFQLIRYIKIRDHFPKLVVLNIIALAAACCFMLTVLYETFATLDYTRQVADAADLSVGFPYSLLFYILAFIQTCGAGILIIKQQFDYQLYLQTKLKQTQVHEDVLQKQYDAERDRFRRYRNAHPDEVHLRPHSHGGRPYSSELRPGEGHSPRHSPRPSPRNSAKVEARYQELLERSRNHGHPDNHSRSRDHSPRPGDRSPRPHDHSPRPRDHFPGPHGHEEKSRSRSPRQNHDDLQKKRSSSSDNSPAPTDRLMDSRDPQQNMSVNMGVDNHESVPQYPATTVVTGHEQIELDVNIVNDEIANV